MNVPEVCLRFEGRLIVSCQAEQGEALDGLMDRFARAAVDGGAAGIRANGVSDIRAIRQAVDVPIIGIQKSLHTDGRILITPSFESAHALVEAGTHMIALDCTARGRQSGAFERMRRVKAELGVPVLADIATVEEAVAAAQAGADFVLSTLRGYTEDTAHIREFDPTFIESLVRASPVPVIAEGRVDTPELARRTIRLGAYCVIVGTTITRPHVVTRLFANAVEHEATRRSTPLEILGVDLGGTNTKFGLVSSREAALVWEATLPTPAAEGRAALLKHLKHVVREAIARSRELGRRPVAVGIATAGWVDPAAGRVVYATENLPGWTGTLIAAELRQAADLPVFVENDANALAVGEKHFGAAKEFRDFVSITLGTGVGGGCYVGGSLNRGSHFFANALGHICIEPNGRPCTCGQSGCLEAYANRAALLEYADHRYPDAESLIAAANMGDSHAQTAVRRFAHALAAGCATLVQLYDPEALILAGGLAQNNPQLLAALEERLSALVPVWRERHLQIRVSELGYHAGVLGAAAVALEAMD